MGFKYGRTPVVSNAHLRGLSNTVDMIRVDRVNCRVDFCISLRRLTNFVACLVGKRPRAMVVESYEPYEWRKCLYTRQSELSSGLLHLIKETWKFCRLSCWQETRAMVVESYEWRKCLSTRQSEMSSGHLHLFKET